MDSANWKSTIAQMDSIKREIHRRDREGIWDFYLPEVAATEAEITAVEQALTEPLPLHYRAFLLHANGWRSFWQSADLFGTRQLLGGPEQRSAADLLSYLNDDGILRDLGLHADELLPIAAKRHDVDLFVIGRQTSSLPGVVIWFAAVEIERYPDFDTYFLAMMDYERHRDR